MLRGKENPNKMAVLLQLFASSQLPTSTWTEGTYRCYGTIRCSESHYIAKRFL